jgi:hypothetical protein
VILLEPRAKSRRIFEGFYERVGLFHVAGCLVRRWNLSDR